MASRLRALARTAVGAAKSLPERGGAGAPVKIAPRPDKPVRQRSFASMCMAGEAPVCISLIACCALRVLCTAAPMV